MKSLSLAVVFSVNPILFLPSARLSSVIKRMWDYRLLLVFFCLYNHCDLFFSSWILYLTFSLISPLFSVFIACNSSMVGDNRSLALRVNFPKSGVTKTMVFDAQMTVGQACEHIRAQMREADQTDGGKYTRCFFLFDFWFFFWQSIFLPIDHLPNKVPVLSSACYCVPAVLL